MNPRSLALGLVIGLVVAALVGFLLYSELSSIRAKLSDTENSLASTKASLDKCRFELSAAKANVSSLMGQLKTCIQEKYMLSNNLEELRTRYERLLTNYTRLESQYNQLVNKYKDLQEKLVDTMKKYNELKASYQELAKTKQDLEQSLLQLKAKYDELQKEYNRVLNVKQELKEKLSELQEKYNKLQREYSSAISELSSIKQQYNSLSDEYNDLLGKYNKLVNEYNSLRDEYNRLVSALDDAYAWLGLYVGNKTEYLKKFYTKLLSEAVDSTKPLADLVSFRYTDIGWRSFEVFNFTLLYLSYCSDNYVRYVDVSTSRIGVWNNVWQLPNETWRNGCGDCEDLALFDYALLNATSVPGEKLYLVEFSAENWRSGHVGLLVIDKRNKRYYIVDPAGNYHNGIGVYLMLHMYTTTGKEWWHYVYPLDVSWHEKKRLYNYSLAEIVYYDWSTNKIYTAKDLKIYYYTDPLAALQDWIVKFWDAYPLDYIAIIGPNTYTVFKTLTDAAHWIQQHS